MDLCSQENEKAFQFLSVFLEHDPSKAENLGWRVSTKDLFKRYKSWACHHNHKETSIEDMWGIIQIKWPKVTIVGPKGNRAYSGMRLKA
jgi:hypothetical protein